MKKNLLPVATLLFFAGLLIPTAARAQVGWYAGASGGVSAATFAGAIVESSSSTLGPILGGFLSYRFTGTSAVVLEGNWATYGGEKVNLRSGASAGGLDLDLSYVEFPLLINAFRPLSDEVRIMVYFGVSLGFNLSCDTQIAGEAKTSCSESDLNTDAAGTVFSIPVGGGLGYTLQNGSMLAADVRYVWGVNDAMTDALTAVNNRAWQVTAKWFFPLRR